MQRLLLGLACGALAASCSVPLPATPSKAPAASAPKTAKTAEPLPEQPASPEQTAAEQPEDDTTCPWLKDRARNAASFQKRCDEGDGASCLTLGKMRFAGEGAAPDATAGEAFLVRACDLSSAPACDELGQILSEGEGVSVDAARALSLFGKACSLGSAEGCFHQAEAQWIGEGKVTAAGRANMDRACEKGSPEACTIAGLMTQLAGVPEAKRTRQLFQKACDKDSMFGGCDELSAYVSSGPRTSFASGCRAAGIAVDERCLGAAQAMMNQLRGRVFGPLERGCKAGGALACHLLASTSQRGIIVEKVGSIRIEDKDGSHADALYRKACTGGVALACSLLAIRTSTYFADGHPDPKTAPLEKKACDLGHPGACLQMGRRAESTTPKNATAAAKYYTLACDAGSLVTCTDLATMYDEGDLVKRDPTRAESLRKKAKALSD